MGACLAAASKPLVGAAAPLLGDAPWTSPQPACGGAATVLLHAIQGCPLCPRRRCRTRRRA